MPTVAVGEVILIPVDAGRGPFPEERLITFETLHGPIAGFIRASEVEVRNGGSFIRAAVQEVGKDYIAVRLHGSFFTTTGLARIDRRTPFLPAS